ncbi:gliding motility protein GldB-related protein [Sinomicrobium sp.]
MTRILKQALFISTVILLESCATSFSSKKLLNDAENSKINTSDITNFYKAFDLAIRDTINATKIFKRYYFSVGSRGLRDFYKIKIRSKEKFSDFAIGYQDFYKAIEPNISDLTDLESEIRKNYNKFKNLYEKAVFPDLYFVVGSFNSNGTISKSGLLIGTEILSRTKQTNTENWNDDILKISMPRNHIPITVSHELVHFNQKNMKSGKTLLWKSIREGSAEFIAELISGHTDGNYEEFEGKEMAIWTDFKKEMHKSVWGSWQRESENRPRNAGYWIGYIICKSYYQQVGNKKKAIYDILHIQDYDEFLRKSKVDEYVEKLVK